MKHLYLIRYAEAGVKSRYVRRSFERALARNIKKAINASVRVELGRLFLNINHSKAVEDVLKRVAGIHSFSPCEMIDIKNLEELKGYIKGRYCDYVKGKRFRITCRRAGKHNFSSLDVQREIGEVLFNSGGVVDLHTPEININIEIRGNKAYIFTDIITGMGGFPIGTAGKAVILFSGGIDSPVAAYMLLKRGCELIFVMHSPADKHKTVALEVYNYLAENYCYGYEPRIYIINHSLENIIRNVPDRMRQIIFKRLLYKEAEEVAKKENAYAIVTGEVVAQKSSQTLASIMQIEKVVGLPVLRPLAAFDKHEIMTLARRIGTLEISEKVPELCSLTEKGAATSPKDKDFEGIPPLEEDALQLVSMAEVIQGIAKIQTKRVKDIDSAVIIDARRNKEEILEGANISINPLEVFQSRLDKDKRYIIVCEQGILSSEIARNLREKGYDAEGITLTKYFKIKN